MPEIDAPVLREPLAGGSPDARVTMRPMSTGEFGVPRGFLNRGDIGGGRIARAGAMWRGLRKNFQFWTPCPIFLVEHPTAGLVLVDTGLPTAVAHDQRAALGWAGDKMYGLRATEDQPLPARMRQLGIPRSGIGTVVMTHLHLDHAGALTELEDATVVMSKREWRSAHSGKALLRGYLPRQYDLAHDFRIVDFLSEDINSFASFGRSFDLFGDGSIILVSTPGHTWGHISVIVRLKDRECLIAGDAIYTRGNLDAGELPLVLADEHNYKRSVREIRAYKQMTPSALIIPGHDGEFFDSLEEIY